MKSEKSQIIALFMKLFAKSCTDYEKNMYLCTRKLKIGM